MHILRNTVRNRQFTSKTLSLFAIAVASIVMLMPQKSSAANYTVTTLADNESNGCLIGQCTLREAINDANATAQADTISFAAGASSGTIALTGGQLTITGNLTINGPGARNLTVSGNNQSRVILIASPLASSDFTVNISGLTISGGNATPLLIGSTLIGDGGGILNGALLGVIGGTSTLNLSNSVVSGNSTTTLGGGVATRLNSVTNITRSLINGNVSNPVVAVANGTVGGGGISNAAGSTSTVTDSTITDNSTVAIGGGILNTAGTVNLINDTISYNDSTLAGGGAVSLLGTIPPILGVTNLRNTIIAENNDLLATNILGRDVVGVLGSFNSLGNNLIGSNFGAEANFDASAFVGVTPQPNTQADLIGNVTVGNQVIDPLLGALQNNGGLTDTRAITASSPAFNRANNCVTNNTCSGGLPVSLATDQRGAGFNRFSGASVDIGAFELQLGVTAAGVSVVGRAMTSKGIGIEGVAIMMTDTSGTIRTTTTNPLGFYGFDDVEAGGMYVIEAAGRHSIFSEQRYILNIVEDVENVNFILRDTSRLSLSIEGFSFIHK